MVNVDISEALGLAGGWASISPTSLSSVCYATLGTAIILRLAWRVRKDYESFLALGPGGTPSTFAGYLKVTYLRLYALEDQFQPPSLASACKPDKGYLRDLQQRSLQRPKTDGIAPHRQLNQKSCPYVYWTLKNALHALADAHPTSLRKGNSCFEKHGLALFLAPCEPASQSRQKHLNPTCADTGEICHLHPSDSSLHLTLHPVDAALVIASGWGERHPLAGRIIHGSRLLPAGFVMVYTPQNENDIETVLKTVKAAAWFVGGIDLDEKAK